MNATNHIPRKRLLTLLLTAVTVLFLVSLQAYHFHYRPYRQDEAWVVHYALKNIERVGFLDHLLQIFRQLLPENFLQDIWLHLFGHTENIVRYFSTLTTVITLALFHRLAADLFGRYSAWLALVLLGTYSVFMYYSHEARPYAALALGTVGFQWALLRFIRRPDRKRAAITLLLAAIPFYLHPFIVYVYIAQLICILIFVRWDRNLYWRGIMLFVTLAFLVGLRAWINFGDRSGDIRYSISPTLAGLQELYDHYRFNPEILGLLFVAGGVAVFLGKLSDEIAMRLPSTGRPSLDAPAQDLTAMHPRMRFASLWREGWLILSLIVMVALPFLVNSHVRSLTPRNLLIAAPYIVLIAVVALRKMPRQAQLLALFFFCVPFVTQFRSHNGNAGYWELASLVERNYDRDRDRLLVMTSQAWEWIAINYFLHERTELGLSTDDIFYVSWESRDKDSFAPDSINESLFVTGLAKGDWRRMQPFLGEREKLWVIVGNPYIGGKNMLEAIESEYTLYQAVNFPGDTYYRALEVLEYRRHPADLQPDWRYGENFNLLNWRLNDSVQVQPCQTISVDNWWSIDQAIEDLIISTLVLADENGQGVVQANDVPGGIYPTSIWQPDRPYFDHRSLTIPCDIPAGHYPLLLGMFPVTTGENVAVDNLPVRTAQGEATGKRLEYLTTLTVNR